ncbi:glutamine synthetase [Bifidobacterium goeldii]|uniref:Glutamine synthetase n=1 Tax=Bifidobacterium goeldii TaxID=2306975 RepID=A0A430FH86_9BIFI|nr:glutamine synthetase family protein [Bifidobacterium goeldii]RSX52170.1 glutamine synthetase [Bifidobacterium goeldii]
MMLGSFVGLDGVVRSKTIPTTRESTFIRSGMGASPTWAVFCPDSQIAFTPKISVVGDLRLRIDPHMERPLDDHVIWAPTNLTTQEGEVSPLCPRSRLQQIEREAAARGYHALFGFEFEFYLLPDEIKDDIDSTQLRKTQWSAYGTDSFLEREAFFMKVQDMCAESGIPLEQLHCEYDKCQLEASTAPTTPVRAADQAVLTKLIIKRVARDFGCSVSFSPKPFVDLTGNGGHIHFSMTRTADDSPIFSGGDGAYGLSEEGAHAIAGIHEHVCELNAIYAGSPVSQLRLSPDSWSGAAACWGLENREAAIRFCAATKGNPLGANVELKCGDLAANPYYAITCILGSALDGIERQLSLAKETTVDPALLTDEERAERGVKALPGTYDAVTEAFAKSDFARTVLGEDVVEAELAIRELMANTYRSVDPNELARKFRFVW